MSSRKLQQEFDKLQKKVGEGLQLFEEIYEKIGVTENPSLKDKLEGDLRKEIKKLQRSRDQVKQWLSDNSNKLDKEVLLETRSRIENAMERFKEVEKVSKMKQFSNEGLELQTKLGARGLDEAKKNVAAKYVVEVLDELNRQNELLLGEMAQYSHKKKLTSAQLALADLTTKFERNNSHISRLEVVLRHVENYQLEPEKIDEIRDDLDYYVENNQASDFIEYDDFYDVLELDELAEEPQPPTLVTAPAPTPALVTVSTSAHNSTPQSAVASPKKAEPVAKSTQDQKLLYLEHKQEKKKLADPQTHPRVTITIGNSISNANTNTNTNSNANASPAPMSAPSFSAAAAAATAPPTSAPTTSTRAPPPGLNPSKPATPVQVSAKLTVAEELKKKALTQAAKSPAQKPAQPQPSAVDAAVHQAVSASVAAAISNQLAAPLPVLAKQPQKAPRKVPLSVPFWDNSANVAALAHSRLNQPLPFHVISQQLEASLLNCPDSFDLERPRLYNPTNVHPSSIDYPQEPMFELNATGVMRKFDTDTLFFCFYYNETQDALAKWNAARELSRRGWVFNLATKQWFHKEERPKSRSILSGIQNGDTAARAESYKYFDYESSWLVRRKDNFTFDGELQRTF